MFMLAMIVIHLFSIHLTNFYEAPIYHLPGTLLDTGDIVFNTTES